MQLFDDSAHELGILAAVLLGLGAYPESEDGYAERVMQHLRTPRARRLGRAIFSGIVPRRAGDRAWLRYLVRIHGVAY